MKQKIAAMTAALAATFCVSADVVQYYDPTDPARPRKEADCTPITSTTTNLAPGWYAVDADVTMTGRITVSGNVNLILCDGATLNATNGVQVAGSNSLTVYGQAKGTGALFALSPAIYYAGIGGNDRESGGTLTVNGGRLTVRAASTARPSAAAAPQMAASSSSTADRSPPRATTARRESAAATTAAAARWRSTAAMSRPSAASASRRDRPLRASARGGPIPRATTRVLLAR